MSLFPIYFVLVRFMLIFIDILILAMSVRAILSWFYDGDGVFVRFLYVFTEPAIMPLRKLFYKMNWFQGIPVDVSYGSTYIVLMIVQILLNMSL